MNKEVVECNFRLVGDYIPRCLLKNHKDFKYNRCDEENCIFFKVDFLKSQLSKRIDAVSIDDLKEYYRKFSSPCLLLDDDILIIKQFFKKLLGE